MFCVGSIIEDQPPVQMIEPIVHIYSHGYPISLSVLGNNEMFSGVQPDCFPIDSGESVLSLFNGYTLFVRALREIGNSGNKACRLPFFTRTIRFRFARSDLTTEIVMSCDWKFWPEIRGIGLRIDAEVLAEEQNLNAFNLTFSQNGTNEHLS